jgi:plastocyanin
MDNETLFYVCGIVLAVSALVVSFAGLKMKGFPGKALPAVVLWFAAFVLAATTFAVKYSGEEHEAKAAEYGKFNEEIEQQIYGASGNEGGAQGGESEASEEQAEEEAEGPIESEEPVGPTENETGEKPSNQEAKGESSKGGEAAKGGGGAASTTLDLEASETELAYDTTNLSAKAGKVTIDFKNPSALEHNVVIEQNGKELAGFEPIAQGEASESAELKPGTYTFYCSVPGHREAGMQGTLTVK